MLPRAILDIKGSTAQFRPNKAPLRRLRHGICVAKMLDNVGLRARIVLRGKSPSHSATAAPASVRCFRHWRRSPYGIR